MASSISNLVNNLCEGLHRIKCKLGHDNKRCETCGIEYKHCNCFLEYTNFKDDLIEYKFETCRIKYKHCDCFLEYTNFKGDLIEYKFKL